MAAVIGQTPAFHRKPVGNYAPSQNAYPQDQQYARAPSMGRNPSPGYNGSMPSQSTQVPGQSRRTLSNATSSSTASNGASNGNTMQRVPTGSAYAGSIRRSTSSRSNGSASPTSYVALMRKQKATVWCDRAQQQDPRVLAAQRQAKMRAVMEVAGGQAYSQQARISTSSSGGVRSKIRHHGAPKAKDYSTGNLSGAGVPMRLSATEVDEGDSDDERSYHQRDSRSRSSMSSVGRAHGGHNNYRGYDASPPSATSPVESLGDLAEEQTPMPEHFRNQGDYFGQAGGSGNSGSSGEAEQSFGNVGGLPQTTRQRSDSEHLTSDELRRRGSVDDRTMTMSGVRLFVANPDLSD